MKMMKAIIAALFAHTIGTWREGYKAANAKALTFTSWDALYDWAESGRNVVVPAIVVAKSTDVFGGRHTYTDTYRAGFTDFRIGLYEEMVFIGNVNSGDFFRITSDWLRMLNSDEIIPPGHY
jgi:hypothetical protein